MRWFFLPQASYIHLKWVDERHNKFYNGTIWPGDAIVGGERVFTIRYGPTKMESDDRVIKDRLLDTINEYIRRYGVGNNQRMDNVDSIGFYMFDNRFDFEDRINKKERKGYDTVINGDTFDVPALHGSESKPTSEPIEEIPPPPEDWLVEDEVLAWEAPFKNKIIPAIVAVAVILIGIMLVFRR